MALLDGAIVISIHAPVKGATVKRAVRLVAVQISIHAPVKGATGGMNNMTMTHYDISIHAPVKGATSPTRKTINLN